MRQVSGRINTRYLKWVKLSLYMAKYLKGGKEDSLPLMGTCVTCRERESSAMAVRTAGEQWQPWMDVMRQ